MKRIRIVFLSLLLLLLQHVKLSAQWTWPTNPGNAFTNNGVNNVGIGINNPVNRLDVNGTIGLTNMLDQNGFNPNGLVVNGAAQVNANFGGLLIHSSSYTSGGVLNSFWGQNFDYRANNDIRYRVNGATTLMQFVNGNMYFYTGATGTAGNQIPNFAFMPKVSLANNGGFGIGNTFAIGNTTGQGVLSVENNIGLGTQAPTAQFHSTGSVRLQGLPQNNFVTDVVMRDGNGNLSYRNLSTIIPTLQNAWVLNGNTPAAGEFLGTTNATDLRINTNGLQRMVVSSQGNVGINTTSPTAYFHVNCVGGNPDDGGVLSDVRFEGLETGTGSVLVIDKFGYVHNSRVPVSSGGISNNCNIINMLPKVADANGNLTCSQIYDDGSFVGVATTSPYFVNGTMSKLNVNGLTVSNSFYAISDGKYKQNVETISDASSIINRLRGVTYTWNKNRYADKNFEDGTQAGFIAQEVNSVYPLAVGIDQKDNYVINYNAFIPLLTRGQQELYTMVNALKDKNAILQKKIDDLQNQVNQVTKGNNVENALVLNKNIADNKLYQNKPNPFSNSTTIEYDMVKMKNSAYIIVYDLSGKELSRAKINSPGHGSVQINSGQLHNGMYLYSLIIDGEEADTKKMVLLKN